MRAIFFSKSDSFDHVTSSLIRVNLSPTKGSSVFDGALLIRVGTGFLPFAMRAIFIIPLPFRGTLFNCSA